MIRKEWLKEAKYSAEYVTDDVLVLDRKRVWIADGYRPITIDLDRIRSLFNLPLCEEINRDSNIRRTYAKQSFTRYTIGNSFVTINDEYSYLWKKNRLFTLQPCVDEQYLGPVGIIDNYGYMLGIVSPIQVENPTDMSYWKNVDMLIGVA